MGNEIIHEEEQASIDDDRLARNNRRAIDMLAADGIAVRIRETQERYYPEDFQD